MLYGRVAPLRQDPNPHPHPPARCARCPPPTPCGGLEMLCGRCTPKNLQPEPHPHPPLAPVRPRPSASSGARSAGLLAAPLPLPEGGLNYSQETIQTLIECPIPTTRPANDLFYLFPAYRLCQPHSVMAGTAARPEIGLSCYALKRIIKRYIKMY